MEELSLDSIKESVFKLIRTNTVSEKDSITEEAFLKQDLGIDSIKLVDLVIDIEEEFSFRVEAKELDSQNFNTVSSVIAYVGRKLNVLQQI